MQFNNILIVDDEPAARRKLRSILSQLCCESLIAEAHDGEDAVQQILGNQFDLVFMDIQMPVMSGLEVAIKTQHKNYQLIFVTAFDDYAIAAFDTYAVDYLLKPVSTVKLQQSLYKITQINSRLSSKELKSLTDEINIQKSKDQLAIRSGSATVIINAEHICYLEALSGFCRIILTKIGQQVYNTDSLLSDAPLEFVFQQLPEKNFLRIHRKYVINVEQILAYYSISRRMYIKLRDFTDISIPVSRRNSALVKTRWHTV